MGMSSEPLSAYKPSGTKVGGSPLYHVMVGEGSPCAEQFNMVQYGVTRLSGKIRRLIW